MIPFKVAVGTGFVADPPQSKIKLVDLDLDAIYFQTLRCFGGINEGFKPINAQYLIDLVSSSNYYGNI